MNKNSKRYGAQAAAGALLGAFLANGTYNVLSIYLLPLSERMGASITSIALLFTFGSVGSMIGSFLLGALLKRMSAKALASIGSICFGLFFIILGFTTSLPLLYVGGALFGFSTVAAGMTIAQTIANWWFVKGRAKVISFITVGIGLGGLVLSPIVAGLIASFGIQKAALIQGISIGALLLINSIFIIPNKPETYGVLPVGAEEVQETASNTNVSVAHSLSVNEILKTVPFWLVTASALIGNLVFCGFLNNASALYQSMGASAGQAALCISVYNLVRLGWSTLYGTASDKFGMRPSSTVFLIITTLTFFASTKLTGMAGAMITASLIGSISIIGMLGAVCLPKIYGAKESASLIGISVAIATIGAMIGSPFAARIYEVTGSYNTFMVIGGVLLIVVIVCLMTATSEKSINKIRMKAEQKASN